MKTESIDVIFTTVPWIERAEFVSAAPALLIAMIEKFGYTGLFYDFNVDIWQDTNLIDFATSTEVDSPEYSKYLNNLLKIHITKILDYNPKFIGLSVFSWHSRNALTTMCSIIREMSPKVKIILGGQGLGDDILVELPQLKEDNLYDYIVYGDGEYAIVDILKGTYGNKENRTFLDYSELNELPFPNYSSYDWNKYAKIIPITGSKGCVRNCTFCDINSLWKKFIWRDGKNIVAEMVHQYNKHNINRFEFTDSLINGSMKSYVDFITTLAEYNKHNNPLSWGGQFIIRPKRQMPEDIWKLTAESGSRKLVIGIESGSERIRDHMRKKFSNEDIEFGLKCMKKYGIKCKFLMLVGYVIETDETIQETMDMFTKFKEYANNTIVDISFGPTLVITPGTPLFDEGIAEKENVQLGDQYWNWRGNNTFIQRAEWRDRLINHCKDLGYNVTHLKAHDLLIEKRKALLEKSFV